MDWGLVLGVAAVVTTILGIIFRYVISLSREITQLQQQCTALECLDELRTQVDRLVYRQELEDQQMAKIIHSPIHKRRDALVDKLLANQLEPEEQVLLATELKQLLHEENQADKRLAAALLLARVEWEMAKTGKHHDPEGPW